MSKDQDIAQAHSRDYRFMELPDYMAWSERKLAEGADPALIAHMDAVAAA